ncbi:SDR family oxidoreductase [Salinisphaera sp. G21_0]|uniref:UDP-glucose 4-epimerase family protein n=1 Tax=Salinisphaera sp. G21_0 TaxID=2821094 RepID=UPI001ADD3A06|nr:SDR family oxidoreductase [Salinisphaera sp. G21_0]MBO9480330.1 SDR family oxidoreductase [Salinisphaera sp. G21_0]
MSLNKGNKVENGALKKCLITGASGFVGSALLDSLPVKQFIGIPVYRKPYNNAVSITDINAETDWSCILENIDTVVHAAARVHIMSDTHHDALAEFRRVNLDGTLNLAHQAAEAGVRRFVFISTIKVNGESTFGRYTLNEVCTVPPEDPYALSKYEAEIGIREIADQTGMEVVIIRPPLVYGANVKANFLSLMKLADTPIPLPFGAINNKRSMVYVGNLVDFIIKCIDHPAAANQTFMVSDGEDLSLTVLLRMMRVALGRPARLFSLPASLFHMAGRLSGKSGVIDRLIGDLQVDSAKARNLLGWKPPFTVQQGISATIAAYLEGKRFEDKKLEGKQ